MSGSEHIFRTYLSAQSAAERAKAKVAVLAVWAHNGCPPLLQIVDHRHHDDELVILRFFAGHTGVEIAEDWRVKPVSELRCPDHLLPAPAPIPADAACDVPTGDQTCPAFVSFPR